MSVVEIIMIDKGMVHFGEKLNFSRDRHTLKFPFNLTNLGQDLWEYTLDQTIELIKSLTLAQNMQIHLNLNSFHINIY